MDTDFESIHNHHECAVFEAVGLLAFGLIFGTAAMALYGALQALLATPAPSACALRSAAPTPPAAAMWFSLIRMPS